MNIYRNNYIIKLNKSFTKKCPISSSALDPEHLNVYFPTFLLSYFAPRRPLVTTQPYCPISCFYPQIMVGYWAVKKIKKNLKNNWLNPCIFENNVVNL